MLKRFTKNENGRDLIVGDIHGHFTKLQAALDAIGFDPEADRLFSVGDLVDRGPESDQATDWLAKPWFHAVSGNHEDFAIRWPNGHMDAGNYVANGGGWNVANPPEECRRLSDAFAALPVAIELETAAGLVGIVHADCPLPDWSSFSRKLQDPSIPNSERRHLLDMAQWSRERISSGDTSGVQGVRAVIVGHTPLQHPVVLGNVIHIDTGGWLANRSFTILDAETLQLADFAHMPISD